MSHRRLCIVRDSCNGLPTNLIEIIDYLIPVLNGVQVVAGSNPVAPTKKRTNRTVELAKLTLTVFLFVNHAAATLGERSVSFWTSEAKDQPQAQ